jgi:hypothetical protein
MDEYPLALYKSGSAFLWEGLQLDMLIVDDAEAASAAKADGWLPVADVAAAAAEPAKKGKTG